MHRLLTCAVVCFIAGVTAHAKLDETEAEIEKRFGKPQVSQAQVAGADKAVLYETPEYSIYALYVGGKVVSQGYTRNDKGAFGEAEIEKLLEENAPEGQKWKNFRDRKYTWDNSNALAVYRPENKPPMFLVERGHFWAQQMMEKERKNAVRANAEPCLGKTSKQIESLYGKRLDGSSRWRQREVFNDMLGTTVSPFGVRDSILLGNVSFYSSYDTTLTVLYYEKKASAALFDGGTAGGRLTDEQIGRLLQGAAPAGTKWNELPFSAVTRSWVRSDGAVTAHLKKTREMDSLLFIDLEPYQRMSGALEQERRETLKRF